MGRHRDVEERGRRSGDLESTKPEAFLRALHTALASSNR